MKVRITATEVVEYKKIVEMTEEDFASYEAAIERREKEKWFADFAERFIDSDDIEDSRGFRDVEVERIGGVEE